LAAVNLAVTVPRALSYPLWQDEVGAARVVVARSFTSVLTKVTAHENHPPAFYALAWLVHRLGVPAVGARALSVGAAATLTLAVVLYARRLLPLYLAGLAGLMVGLSWQLEMHGWELRPYALLALISFAGVLAVERAAVSSTRARVAQLVLVVAVGALLHDYFVFTLAACVLWLFVSSPARSRKVVLGAIGIGLVPLALWTPRFLDQYEHRHFQTLPGFSAQRVGRLYADLLERSLPRGAVGAGVAAAVLALVVSGAARLWRDPGRGRLCALAAVVPVVVAALLWLAGPHVFAPRALIGVLPFAGICCAAALAWLPRSPALVASAAVAVVIVVGFSRADGRIVPNYDRVAAALVASGWRPQEPIVLFGPLYQYLDPLDWYLPGTARLAPASPRPGRCDRAFVVAVGGRARVLVRGGDGRGIHRVGGVLVARRPWRTIRRQARDEGGTVIGTRATPCVTVRWAGEG
jgi:hypothetical protein